MILHCYVDQETEEVLREQASRLGRTMEDLAESAISETCLAVRLEQSKASNLRSPKLL